MNAFAVNIACAAPHAAAAAIAAAVEEVMRPRPSTGAAVDAPHARFARARERVSSTRAAGVLRIDLDAPGRHTSEAPNDMSTRDPWAEPLAEEPERWDGLS